MKTKLSIFFLLLFLSVVISGHATTLSDPEKDKIIIYVLKNMLTRGHFVEKDLDDDFSELVFHSFIDGLDPSKRYFTQADIRKFSKYKYRIDNQIINVDLSFYHLVYDRFIEKVRSAKQYYGKLLGAPFNYKKKETINVDFKQLPYAENENQLIDYWRKQLKLQVISKIQEKEKLQEEKYQKDNNYKKASFKTLEEEVRAEVLKNMDELYQRIEELEHSDWFSTFLNSIVGGFDPHTTYMSPRIKDRFDQNISGKLEGIGARLQKKGIYTHIVELVSGGPAWKQGDLEPGDIILKVAQAEKEPLDIVGMRLDDAIKFIKGPKGTEVRLTVKKKLDGSTKVISIIRDVVELEETFVKSSVVTKNGKKYGVIDLPKFYIDFSDITTRDSAKDMEKEIERLKAENVDGLIIDLRNNGGGSLKTAVEIAGLFINKGPIVQVKYRGEKPIIRSDRNPKIQWDGKLVILVNELSASASEILAAAMQDYNRAVILGGNQTFGKGTVQQVIPMNQFYPSYKKDIGFLKMTIQKFYRINGGSTQVEGVYPDIAMPSRYSYMKFGERDMEGALPWDKVPQASYVKTNSYDNFSDVVNESKERIASSINFKLINEYAKWLKQEQDDTSYSLNYRDYVKDVTVKEADTKKFDAVFEFSSNLTFNSPKYELVLLSSNEDLKLKRERWHKNLTKDMYINEALNVLNSLRLAPQNEIVKN
ncbi:MAG: tail-specific protease [Flavobacteriaceae bacterium]|nr:MAG: tail-specific protease [Flavobacteriaceae bacterium]